MARGVVCAALPEALKSISISTLDRSLVPVTPAPEEFMYSIGFREHLNSQHRYTHNFLKPFKTELARHGGHMLAIPVFRR